MTNQLPISDVTRRLDADSFDVWQVHYDALARQAASEDVLVLSVGDPDFPTPPLIAEYLYKTVGEGRTHYSPAGGEPVLLKALADLETHTEGRTFHPENFTIFPGATAALHDVLACILNPGDEILAPDPMYIGYHGIFTALGAVVRTAALQPGSFELTVDAISSGITPATRVVLINTPGNPCGNIVSSEVLTEVARLCNERGIWLVCDEVYSLFTYDEPHVSALKAAASLDNVIVIDSLSKSHAMSGWRIGWAVASTTFTSALHRYCGASLFGCSQFIQDAAAFALSVNTPHIEQMRSQYRARRDLVVDRIAGFNYLRCYRPRAGMFVMLDVSATGMTGDAYARRLLDEQGVSVIPGAGFGVNTRDYVRLSLTVPETVLTAALDRMARQDG